MSWEDCGFRPGPVEPAACPRGACSDCDGQHHFDFEPDEDDGEIWFQCRHCEARAEALEDDVDAGDDMPDHEPDGAEEET